MDYSWQYFDMGWFRKHQATLLYYLNTFPYSFPFRRLMGLNQSLTRKEKILVITPDSITVQIGKNKYRTEYRTHWKFSKRIYFRGKYWWKLLHWLDEILMDRYLPALSFGFDTLTEYPDPGVATGGTCDGYCGRISSGSSWDSIRDGDGNIAYGDTTTIFASICADSRSGWYFLERSVMSFDTTPIPSTAIINSADLYLYGDSKTNALGSTPLDVCRVVMSSADSVAQQDYNLANWETETSGSLHPMVEYGTIAYSSFSTTAYNKITLDVDIIKAASITEMGIVLGWDQEDNFGGTWVKDAQTYLFAKSADVTGTSQDPKLVVDYTTFAPIICLV